MLALFFPQSPPDPFLDLVKATELPYTETAKDFVFETKIGERKQTIYIRKAVETYRTLKTREILTHVWSSPSAPNAIFTNQLFERRFALGGMTLEKPAAGQSEHRIRFRWAMDTEAIDKDRLRELVEIFGATGDMLEQQLDGRREDRF